MIRHEEKPGFRRRSSLFGLLLAACSSSSATIPDAANGWDARLVETDAPGEADGGTRDEGTLDAASTMEDVAGAPVPLRLVIFVTHHGVLRSFWPAAGSTAVPFDGPLAPLMPFADRLTLVRGISARPTPPKPSHINDDILNAPWLLTGKVRWSRGGLLDAQAVALAPSLDTLLAGTPARTLCFTAGLPFPTFPEAGPHLFWQAAEVPKACPETLSSFASAVGEVRPDSAPVQSAAFFANDVAEVIEMGVERLAQGAAATLGIWYAPGTVPLRTLIGFNAMNEWHDFMHGIPPAREAELGDAVAMFNKYTALQASVVARIATALANRDEVDGSTLLDNTVVLWTSPLGHPSHDENDIPVVILGDARGRLQVGRYLELAPRSSIDLLATLAEAMEIPGFPPEGMVAQPIAELLR